MTRVNDELVAIMRVLEEQSRLNPKGTTLQIKSKLLKPFPNHHSLLKKLAEEYEVISIEMYPDSKEYGAVDHDMYQSERPKEYERYMSYFVSLNPSFASFYKAEYLKQRSTAATLTDNNRELVISTMKAIDDELSLTGLTEVAISPVKNEEDCRKALSFLQKVGAIKTYKAVDEIDFNGEYERMMPTGQIDVFSVEVILPEFDDIFTEVTKEKKRTSTTHIEDAPLGQLAVQYDEEHAKATYNGKTEKLFDTGTIMSVLTHRVFRADGARMPVSEILNDIESRRIEPDKDLTTKTLTNAKDRVNDKFTKAFNLKNVICYERQEFWLNHDYCSLESGYRMATSGN